MRHSGSGGIGNRLLAALPPADFDLLVPELETVALDQDAVLSREGDRIEHVFFPHSGAISLMIDMADGQTVATAAVGREGAVGILSVFGPSPSASSPPSQHLQRLLGPVLRGLRRNRHGGLYARGLGDEGPHHLA